MSSIQAILNEDPIFAVGPLYTLPSDAAPAPEPESTDFSAPLAPLTKVTGAIPAGQAFHHLIFPRASSEVLDAAAEAAEADAEADEALHRALQRVALDDYYGLLDLSDRGLKATEEEIREKYRKINLLLHPDKATPAMRDDAEARFRALQKGFEVLTTPQLRLEFDSEYGADDSLPDPSELPPGDVAAFLALYTPVFARNAIYSTVKPVPGLGGPDASLDELQSFYAFWNGFKSWREFARGDTEKCGDSASRDERRRAAQKNKKQRENLKKEEIARIRRLATQAAAADPRLALAKARAVEDKKLEKLRAFEKKKADEAERLQRQAEAKAAAEAAAKLELVRKQQEEAARKRRLIIRNFLLREPTLGGDSGALVTRMFDEMGANPAVQTAIEADFKSSRVPMDPRTFVQPGTVAALPSVQALAADLRMKMRLEAEEAAGSAAAAAAAIAAANAAAAAAAAAAEAEAAAAKKAAAGPTVWTLDELSMLAKAMERFPTGTKERWRKVAEAIDVVGHKTEKEVIRKVKEQEVARQMETAEGSAFAVFRQKIEKEKELAVKFNKASMAMLVHGDDDALSQIPQVKAIVVPGGASKEGKGEKKDKKDKKEDKKDKESSSSSSSEKKDKKDKKSSSAPVTTAAAAAPAPAASAGSSSLASSDDDVWSAAQQASLEGALRSVPKDAADRWDQIAEKVEGKTRAQCVARFKQIRDELLRKKAAAAAAAAQK